MWYREASVVVNARRYFVDLVIMKGLAMDDRPPRGKTIGGTTRIVEDLVVKAGELLEALASGSIHLDLRCGRLAGDTDTTSSGSVGQPTDGVESERFDRVQTHGHHPARVGHPKVRQGALAQRSGPRIAAEILAVDRLAGDLHDAADAAADDGLGEHLDDRIGSGEESERAAEAMGPWGRERPSDAVHGTALSLSAGWDSPCMISRESRRVTGETPAVTGPRLPLP
jgi:hypothetical protein